MGRKRNPDRDRAKEIWLSADPDTIRLKDIADQLGCAENAVRKWKSEDNWESERSGKKNRSAPKKKKRPGAPKGNRNAVGHGAPVGNQNAYKHGGYSEILFDTMDEEEQELIKQMSSDEEQMLIEEIQILTVRERRILKRIEEHKKSPISVSGTVRIDHKRDFDSDEDKKLYAERIKEKVESKERLPGREYSVHNTAEASYSIIMKLEEVLTRCQSQKQRDIDSLNKIRSAKQSSSTEIEDMYTIRKAVFGDGDDSSNDT